MTEAESMGAVNSLYALLLAGAGALIFWIVKSYFGKERITVEGCSANMATHAASIRKQDERVSLIEKELNTLQFNVMPVLSRLDERTKNMATNMASLSKELESVKDDLSEVQRFVMRYGRTE